MTEYEPRDPAIALIGGGTGSCTLLKEIKTITPNISAIVNMSDDGGSTGRLRDELDVLPPGDIRQCLTALSNREDASELFSYRFGGEGSLAGQSLGNLILSGLELQHKGDISKALRVAGSLLDITGEVIPVTTTKHTLVMSDGDEITIGEHAIANKAITHTPKLWLDPPAAINKAASRAIMEADTIVIAPGNFYGSIIPAVAVDGMKEALAGTEAKKVMITNLVNKPGQTDDWHVVDYVRGIEAYTGPLDAVIYNTAPPAEDVLRRYADHGELPVRTEKDRFSEIGAVAIGAPLLAREISSQDPHDSAIRRTLIRHNARRVTDELRIFIDRKQIAA